jgi:iron complex transport system substrate-binding protein
MTFTPQIITLRYAQSTQPYRLYLSTLIAVFWLGSIAQAEPVQRLVSTDAAVTELVFALQADSRLIAVDVTSQLPQGYRPLENIGYHRNLSAEGLLSLSPTYVIGSEHMGPAGVLDALKAANIPLLQLASATSTQQLESNIKAVALALGAQQKGQQLVTQLHTKLRHLETRPLNQKRVAVLLSMEPTKLRLAGTGTAAHSFIELLGAVNVADFSNYRTVSAESLMAMQTDVIVVIGRQYDNATQDLLAANPILKHSPAFQQGHIIAIDGGALVAGLSVAAVEEAMRISNQIHGSAIKP